MKKQNVTRAEDGNLRTHSFQGLIGPVVRVCVPDKGHVERSQPFTPTSLQSTPDRHTRTHKNTSTGLQTCQHQTNTHTFHSCFNWYNQSTLNILLIWNEKLKRFTVTWRFTVHLHCSYDKIYCILHITKQYSAERIANETSRLAGRL